MKTKSDIFKIINAFPWSKIKANYGYCENIEEALAGIISEDATIREKSYWKLDNHVVVQANLSEGAFFVVPFVIELFKSNEIDDGNKYELFNLLFEIANGVSSELISYNINLDDGFEYYIKGTDYKDENLRIACRNKVLKHFHFFMMDLFNVSSGTRKYSLELLSSFIEHHSIIKYELKALLKSEKDKEIISSLNEAIRAFEELC